MSDSHTYDTCDVLRERCKFDDNVINKLLVRVLLLIKDDVALSPLRSLRQLIINSLNSLTLSPGQHPRRLLNSTVQLSHGNIFGLFEFKESFSKLSIAHFLRSQCLTFMVTLFCLLYLCLSFDYQH